MFQSSIQSRSELDADCSHCLHLKHATIKTDHAPQFQRQEALRSPRQGWPFQGHPNVQARPWLRHQAQGTQREIMPKPRGGESQSDYISRFMASAEAQKDYPEQKQRAAVAYSMWEHRNAMSEGGWPLPVKIRHLEPGLVRYQDLGPADPATGQPKGMTLLLRKNAIDRMRPTFRGKPIINQEHEAVSPAHFEDGKAHGIVTDAWFNADDGWDWIDAMIWDPRARQNAESGSYFGSCAYRVTNVDETPGVYHGIPYDGEILDGHYTHMALVPNPRYGREAEIICNSLGGTDMFKLLFKRAGVANAVEIDKKAEVAIDGKKVAIEELVNSYKAEEAKKTKVEAKDTTQDELKNALDNIHDDYMFVLDGKDVPFKDLKNAYLAQERRNADEKEADEKKKKEEEERRNADEKAKKDAEEKEAKEKEMKNAADTKTSSHFQDLKNAAERRGEPQKLVITSPADREKLGAERYGSKPTEPTAKK
ncbi:DUF2213 domain-containing protein [Patescibacteria group bacterium]|nr:MAG: DUF2213 domain-containing protein [Patescibacteria group bacterium]